MPIRIAVALILSAAVPALPSAALHQEPPSTATAGAAMGRYEYRDDEAVGFLELRADRTFEYRMDGIGQPPEGEEPLHLLARGVWRSDGLGDFVLENAPTAPPVLRQTSATRDAGVRAALIIVQADGGIPDGIGLQVDDGQVGGLYMLSDGGWTIPLTNGWDDADGKQGGPSRLPRSWEIVRSGDSRPLAKIVFSPGGPNRFTFSYTPSPIEPFQLAARLVEDEPGTIEVELGSASVRMRRASGPVERRARDR